MSSKPSEDIAASMTNMALTATTNAPITGDDGQIAGAKMIRPLFFTKVVIILVGPDEQRFTAHKDLLCSRSPFFKAAWTKDEEKVVRLPEHSAAIFQLYLERVYDSSGHFDNTVARHVQNCARAFGKSPLLEDGLVALHYAISFWLLCDYLGDVALGNEVMDVVFTDSRTGQASIPLKSVEAIMTTTTNGCGLQRWLVDYLTFTIHPIYHQSIAKDYPIKPVREVLQRSLPHSRGKDVNAPTSANHYYDRSTGDCADVVVKQGTD